MSDIARAVLVGRLTRDPELNDTGRVLRLGLAVNRSQKGEGDVYIDAVSYFDVKVLGNRAAGLATFLAKGRQIAVDARAVQERWEAADGTKRSAVVFIADEVVPLGSRDENASTDQPTLAGVANGGVTPTPDESIPF